MTEILSGAEAGLLDRCRLLADEGLKDRGLRAADEIPSLLALIDRLVLAAGAPMSTPEEEAALDANLNTIAGELDERLAVRIVDATEGLWRPLAVTDAALGSDNPIMAALAEEARLFRRERMLRLVREEIARWWEPSEQGASTPEAP